MHFLHRCRFTNAKYLYQRFKSTIDYSKVPVILEKDLEEQFVRGSGPGGQKTNKTSNCVVLKHIPTGIFLIPATFYLLAIFFYLGIVVKCHESRLQQENRELAKSSLVRKLDNLINGDYSVDAQKKIMKDKKSSVNHHRRAKLRVLKERWKQENEISNEHVE